MFFRRSNRAPRPAQQRHDFPRVEYIPMSLAELQAFEQVMVHGDACLRRGRPDLTSLHDRSTELIGRLYQSAGAASVHQADPDRVRIPIQKGELFWLESAIRDIERYRGDPHLAHQGRQLLNRFNALLGQQRAVIHAGGTPMFDPGAPAPVLVDAPQLPAR
ncbi:hypothetical protein ACPCTN_31635 [Streptomyces cinereoruber]|uniref:hypothetical protein n=1 Tax=Streptomyces cinereoruber TaxID=67260 RepID=UPI003C2EDF5D